MAKFRQLGDLYQFPGFVPQPSIRGVFGDPQSVVVLLCRRQKKRFALFVAGSTGLATISALGMLEISLVATSVSISSTCYAESNVGGAGA
jgi:hypothetical protein